MTPHALDGSFHRVRRAEERLADLQPRMEVLTRQHVDAVVFKYDPDPPHEPLFEYISNINVPMSMAVCIGEICYNLRSAMDYLVFALALLDSGREQPKTQFPIEGSAKRFRWCQDRGWLEGVNAAHVAVIERLQPYRGCEWSSWLKQLSNTDKHREFVLVKSVGMLRFVEWSNPTYSLCPFPEYSAYHPIHGEVNVKLDISVEMTFRDGTPVMKALEKIKAGVAQTLTDFKPEF